MYYFGLLLTSNQEDIKDLIQETNFKVLNNIDKYRNNKNFKAWVFTIMRNIFINNYRKTKYISKQTDLLNNLYLLNLHQNSGLTTPDECLDFQEIMIIVNSFTDNYKTPFLMHLEGYKYYEISEILYVPLGTIKSRIFFIRKELQNLLHEYL